MTDNTNEIATTDHQPPRVRQCVFVLSLSLLFSLFFFCIFLMCARMFPRMLHFGRKKYSEYLFILSLSCADGSIDLDFKSIPKPCEN